MNYGAIDNHFDESLSTTSAIPGPSMELFADDPYDSLTGNIDQLVVYSIISY